jgi:hypothetical protein
MKTIVIDSRDNISGTNTNFKIQLIQELVAPRKGTLLFANLPTGQNNVESYFLLRIQEFGISVQSGSPNGYGTFIVPVTTGSGYRNIHQFGQDFASSSNIHNTITQLNVEIIDRTGTIAQDAGEVLFIIQVE